MVSSQVPHVLHAAKFTAQAAARVPDMCIYVALDLQLLFVNDCSCT